MPLLRNIWLAIFLFGDIMAQSILGFNNLDEFFAFHAAPAIAGIKPANLSSCPAGLMPQAEEILADYEKQFKDSHTRFKLLCRCHIKEVLLMEIAVIYWSGTGNTKMMAEAVAEGIAEAGAQAVVKSVSEITPDEAAAYDKIAFGCSAMGAEVLEETEFEPFFTMVEDNLKGKKVVLFGSYGWGGSYMQDWEARVQADGAELLHPGVLAMGEPDDAARQECKEIGSLLAKA